MTLALPTPIATDHDLSHFDCGDASLNDWLRRRAIKNQTSGASRCFVLCNGAEVIAYYCLCAGAISLATAPGPLRRNMPDPLPVLLLGRLAVDHRHHNQGLGRALLRDAMLRAVRIADETGVVAILVHALSDPARQFYRSCGFVESPLQPMTLMMTIATVRAILEEAGP